MREAFWLLRESYYNVAEELDSKVQGRNLLCYFTYLRNPY